MLDLRKDKAGPAPSTQFQYDPLNRILQANTITTTGANCWGEGYTIDNWGNLTNRSGVSGMTGCLTEPLNDAPASVQNHLSSLSYDAAGNVTGPVYDAESRIVGAGGVGYTYDADSQRMEKSNGTFYWYGSGDVLAESDLNGNINEEYIFFNGQRIARVDRPSGTVHYYFSNHLGSHTMITSATGACEQDIEYYPYGGVVADHCPNVAQHFKFTGKERDSESGLDMFGARYYGSSLGRFMTPDWSNILSPVPYASVDDPQTLNLYSYVGNNPTTLYDPDGHCFKNGFAQFFCNLGQRIDNGVHGLGFHTDAQVEDIFHRDVLWIRKNSTQDVEKMSTKQVIDYYNGAHAHKQYVDSGDTRFYLNYAITLAGAVPPKLYRGGTNMEGRPNIDLKIDKETGLVKPGRGISLNQDPSSLERFGGANEIDQSSVPEELEIVQTNKPGHYELAPRQPMTVERYNELAGQVRLK